MNIQKSRSGKWFEDQYKLTDLLSLSVAVTRINGGYIKKDADIKVDDNGCQTQLPNLFIINNHLGIEKFKSKKNGSGFHLNPSAGFFCLPMGRFGNAR